MEKRDKKRRHQREYNHRRWVRETATWTQPLRMSTSGDRQTSPTTGTLKRTSKLGTTTSPHFYICKPLLALNTIIIFLTLSLLLLSFFNDRHYSNSVSDCTGNIRHHNPAFYENTMIIRLQFYFWIHCYENNSRESLFFLKNSKNQLSVFQACIKTRLSLK